jgi:hypothetical protein
MPLAEQINSFRPSKKDCLTSTGQALTYGRIGPSHMTEKTIIMHGYAIGGQHAHGSENHVRQAKVHPRFFVVQPFASERAFTNDHLLLIVGWFGWSQMVYRNRFRSSLWNFGNTYVANQNLTKVMNGLGHKSDDDMHLICLSRNRKLNQWQTSWNIRSVWFLKIDTHSYCCGCCLIEKYMRWHNQPYACILTGPNLDASLFVVKLMAQD